MKVVPGAELWRALERYDQAWRDVRTELVARGEHRLVAQIDRLRAQVERGIAGAAAAVARNRRCLAVFRLRRALRAIERMNAPAEQGAQSLYGGE